MISTINQFRTFVGPRLIERGLLSFVSIFFYDTCNRTPTSKKTYVSIMGISRTSISDICLTTCTTLGTRSSESFCEFILQVSSFTYYNSVRTNLEYRIKSIRKKTENRNGGKFFKQ